MAPPTSRADRFMDAAGIVGSLDRLARQRGPTSYVPAKRRTTQLPALRLAARTRRDHSPLIRVRPQQYLVLKRLFEVPQHLEFASHGMVGVEQIGRIVLALNREQSGIIGSPKSLLPIGLMVVGFI